MPGDYLTWLLESNQPAMRYLASRDLVRPRPGERTLSRLRAEVTRRGWVKTILARQKGKTYWVTRKTCYVPKFRSTIWQLQVLADLGVSRRHERIANAVELWLDLHVAKDGGYTPWSRRERPDFLRGWQVYDVRRRSARSRRERPDSLRAHPRHPEQFMKRGHLCTTGNMVRSLLRLGYGRDERVGRAIEWLVDEQYEDGGWDCFGRPDGTLDAWEAMSAFADVPADRRSTDVRRAIERGAEFFLDRRLLHEGPRFDRWWWLRYPWHYFYDVLVGLDFMSALGYGKDPRLKEAWDHLASKRRPDGRWNLDSTNGNLVIESRGKPSKMITFLALRALTRAGRPTDPAD